MRTLLLCGLLLLALIPTRSTLANGWEHLAIPRETLLEALASDDPHVVEHAAVSMGVRGEARDVGPLLQVLARLGAAPHAREEVYRALGLIGDRRAVPTLLAALRTEPDESQKGVAVHALGHIGAEQALPVLLETLNAGSATLQARAIDALGAFDQPESVDALADIASAPDTANGARLRALRSLGHTRSPQALPTLHAALESSTDPRTVPVVVQALARIASPRSREPLTALLARTQSAALRTGIASALGAIDDGSTLPTLVRLLEDDSHAVRAAAVRQLTAAGAPETAAALLALYREVATRRPPQATPGAPSDPVTYLTDLDLMHATLRALLETDPATGLPAFLDGAAPRVFPRDSAVQLKLARKAYELRRLAVVGLGYSRSGEAAAPVLDEALSDPDPRIRSAAVRAAGVLGGTDAANRALEALDDPHPEVRWTAALVLGRVGDANDTVAALLDRLRDPHREVRRQAAASLALAGDASAVVPLRALAETDEDAAVRQAARQALSALAPGAEP